MFKRSFFLGVLVVINLTIGVLLFAAVGTGTLAGVVNPFAAFLLLIALPFFAVMLGMSMERYNNDQLTYLPMFDSHNENTPPSMAVQLPPDSDWRAVLPAGSIPGPLVGGEDVGPDYQEKPHDESYF